MKIFYLFFILSIVLLIVSFDNPNPKPDPEAYGKKVVEILNKNDTSLFRKTFAVDKSTMQQLVVDMLNDPYSYGSFKEEVKEKSAERLNDAIEELNGILNESIKAMEEWKRSENLRPGKLEYLRTYFDLEYHQKEGFYVMDKAKILVKHDTVHYLLDFKEIAQIGDKWYGGKLRSISRLNSDFREERVIYDYYDYLNEDRSDETIMDTAYVLPDSNLDVVEPVVPEK